MNTKRIISLVIGAIVSIILYFGIYYLAPTAINLKNGGFIFGWLACILFGLVIAFFISYLIDDDDCEVIKTIIIPGTVWGLGLVMFLTLLFFSSRACNAIDYAKLYPIEEATVEDIPAVETITVMDTQSAKKLATKKLGQLGDKIFQFELGSNENLNINGERHVIFEIDYKSFFKWNALKDEGIPYYIDVNTVTGEAKLVKTEPMKYVSSAHFSQNIQRHVQFQYENLLLTNTHLEIDDNEKSYYITTVYDKKICIYGGDVVTGVIVTDPVTGDSKHYSLEEAPKWIDVIIPGDFLCGKFNDAKTLQNGFWNSVFAQNGCMEVSSSTIGKHGEDTDTLESYTVDYGYFTDENDIMIFSGVTAANSESNVGFMFANERTGEIKMISLPDSANESAAIGAAEGRVQEKGYAASFPSLVRLQDDTIAYILTLKDANNTVQMYAVVDTMDYTHTAVATTKDEAINAFVNNFQMNTVVVENTSSDETSVAEDNTSAAVDTITVYDENGNMVASFVMKPEYKVSENVVNYIK